MLAGATWLNAKAQLSYDYLLLSSNFYASSYLARAVRRDRVNLLHQLEAHATAKRTETAPFLVYHGKEWTYRQVYDTVLKYACWLRKSYGVKHGEIVAMDMMNSPRLVFFWLALWSLDACPAFINYNLVGESLIHCIKVSTARILLADEELGQKYSQEVTAAITSSDFRGGKGPLEVAFVSAAVEDEILALDGIQHPQPNVPANQMASLILTSGTSGLGPKPAIVTWQKYILGAAFASRALRLKQADRFYTCMPLYHASAQIIGLCTCLITGCAFILGHRFSTHTFWPDVRASHATIIQYVGETCRYLLSAPAQTDPATGENLDRKNDVRLAFGNGLRPDIWNRFKERFGIETIAEVYAATEAPSWTFNISSNDFSQGAVGRRGLLTALLFRSHVAIVEIDWATEQPLREPNGRCRPVRPNQPGEVLWRILTPDDLSSSFPGYFRNPRATEDKIIRNALRHGDVWFRSGDLIR